MKAKFRAIPQRVFVHSRRADEIVFLSGLKLMARDSHNNSRGGDIDVRPDCFPNELDTLFPQRVYIVLQHNEALDQFFDENVPGILITLYGFRAHRRIPSVLLVHAETGEPFIPPDSFYYTCMGTERKRGMTERLGNDL